MLDWVELRRCLRGLGFPVSKKETRSLVRAKCGAEGFVTLRQFFEIVDELGSTKRDATREIKHGFKLFTGEGQHITETDLRRAAVTADISADVSKMLAIADVDGDGKVGREDFIHIMSRVSAVVCPTPAHPLCIRKRRAWWWPRSELGNYLIPLLRLQNRLPQCDKVESCPHLS